MKQQSISDDIYQAISLLYETENENLEFVELNDWIRLNNSDLEAKETIVRYELKTYKIVETRLDEVIKIQNIIEVTPIRKVVTIWEPI